MAFRQSAHLIDAIARNDLQSYASSHARLMRSPRTMAMVLLLLGDHAGPRRAALKLLSLCPPLFAGLLTAHTGEWSTL